MGILAIIILLAGLAGAAATYLGMLNLFPLPYWVVAIIVGGIMTIFTRKPGD